MGSQVARPPGDEFAGLIEIEPTHPEPRLVHNSVEPRRVNDLTLVDGKSFLATTVAGDIVPPGAPDVGLFHDDTRFLSRMELRIEGQRALVLSSNTERTLASQIELSARQVMLRDSLDLPDNTVHVRRKQVLSQGTLFDRLTFANYNLKPIEFRVELSLDADFADVFQVRGVARGKRGQYFAPVTGEDTLEFYYRGLDGEMRRTHVEFRPRPAAIEDKMAHWALRLQPQEKVEILITTSPLVGRERVRHTGAAFSERLQQRRDAFSEWREDSTGFHSGNDEFDRMLETCAGDFHALQIPVGGERIIAAGIPWFATIFGRDSLIASLQSLVLNPRLAADTLRVLARFQGKEHNDWRDEEPGKILHEYRSGEMTRNGEMPFGPYYGSVDATPLFLILLSETWNWTGDEQLVRDLLPAAYRALEWIDQHGDLDGDGFVEWSRRSPRGLVNQGWKDSWDANMHADGTVARGPIALSEVQGYVYDAKYRLSSLLRHFGDIQNADRLKKEAAELARRFEKAFWIPGIGYYAMGLDGEKKPMAVVSSNAGQLLFTRIVARDRARAVTQRLMRADMFSGWGWRTLSADERTFNPLSYHRGSVWPHDNSIIAHGMCLNEFRGQAMEVFTSLFQAALRFRDYRLPELFCGVQRRHEDDPVHYPVSCSPQAWASGAMFLMLSSLLGIRPSAPRKELNIVNPMLPEWLEHLNLRHLRIGKTRVDLDFTRRGTRTFCNLVNLEGDRLQVNVVFRKN
jgi:glycogen debranching enzyme